MTDSCSAAQARLSASLDDAACDDGLFCNGAEACVMGRCVPGDAPDCDDEIEEGYILACCSNPRGKVTLEL